MQKIYRYSMAILCLAAVTPLTAQKWSLKPYAGYLYVQMNDANSKINDDIRGWRNRLEAPIEFPGEFNGNVILGGQIEYHRSEEYFFSLNVSYYTEKVATEYNTPASTAPAWQFYYERQVESVDVMLNMGYYLGYSSWKRFNKYLGIGVGVMFLNAKSVTTSTNPTDPLGPVDTRGKFSGNILSGVISVGGNYRLSKMWKLWSELGLQYGNFGQLDGKITTIDNPDEIDVVSSSSFDLTGLYLRVGLGIGLPFK